MEGDHEALPIPATPHSTDTLLSMTEAENEWFKLKPDFLHLSPARLYDLPCSLQDSATLDLRSAIVYDVPSVPISVYVPTTMETVEEGVPIKSISFLYQAKPGLLVTSHEDDFLVTHRRSMFLYSFRSENSTFKLKAKFHDSSSTEHYKVARFVVVLTPKQGVWIVAGGKDGVVKVVSVENHRQSYGLMGHRNTIRDLRPLDDSDFCFSCSDDLTIRLWNIRTRVQVVIFQGLLCPSDSIMSMDVHHSQALMVSGGMDRSVVLWNINTREINGDKTLSKQWNADFLSYYGVRCARKRFGTRLVTQPWYLTYRVHSKGVKQVQFYQDLVVSMDTEGHVCIWQPNITRAACSFILLHSLHAGNGRHLSFSLSASLGLLATITGDNGEILLWNLLDIDNHSIASKKTGKVGEIRRISFTGDGKTVIAGTKEGHIIRFEAS